MINTRKLNIHFLIGIVVCSRRLLTYQLPRSNYIN